MKIESFKNARVVRSAWLDKGGRRLDCNPYMSGALEAREALQLLKSPKMKLHEVTSGIFHAGREGRRWVDTAEYGVPFLGSTDILAADLSILPFISKKQVKRNPSFTIGAKWTLITRSGTIGRTAYVRPDMAGMACSEHVLRVVPDVSQISPGYLYAFLSSKFGVPLVVAGTYGAIIQHIEPEHIANLPVPRFEEPFEMQVHELIQRCANSRSKAHEMLLKVLDEFEDESGLRKGRVGTVTDFSTTLVTLSDMQDRFDAPYHCHAALLAERMLDDSPFPVEKLPLVVDRYFKPPIFKRLWVDSAEYGRLFVSGNDIYRYQPEERRYVSRRTPKFDDFILKKGWVVFQAAGQIYGLFGRPLFVSGWLENTFCADDVFRIVPHNEIDGAFLYLFFLTQTGQALIKRQASGNSIPRVWEPHISRLRVLWPDAKMREKFALPVIEAHQAIEAARLDEMKAIQLVEEKISGSEQWQK